MFLFNLIERLAGALQEADTGPQNIILAALAELSARFMKSSTEDKLNGTRNVVRHEHD